jgi:hypothetical protein
MAEGQGLLSGLSNLPIFEGVDEATKRRALLETGLALMQPQDPLSGGGPVAQLAGGVNAGLASLDEAELQAAQAKQLEFQNLIAQQAADADTTRSGASVTQAEASTSQAATQAQAVENQNLQAIADRDETIRQFDAAEALRDAKVDLDTAQAEWLRRRHDGTPLATSGKITEATINKSFVESRMENLFRADPDKYTLPNGDKNLTLLMDQAFLDLHRATGTAGSDQIGFVAEGADDASRIGENISSIQGQAPAPATPPIDPTASVPADTPVITSVREYEALPSGTTYIHMGRPFRKP